METSACKGFPTSQYIPEAPKPLDDDYGITFLIPLLPHITD